MSKFCGKKLKHSEGHHEILYNMGYSMGRLIGEGTYSKVCIATARLGGGETCEKVACKIIRRKNAGSEFIKKFLPRELDILRHIRHPNIITVHSILEIQNTVYIFMEYCRGGDLLEFVRERGALTESRARYTFRQLAGAVHYLHGRELAHRDIKCENVLLLMAGDGDFDIGQVKLADFGFARGCRDEVTGEKVLSETFCGSAAYAAPEILQGIAYDPKLYDIWALGCILYIMITSTMPFDDSNIKRMLKIQLNKTVCDSFRPWKKTCIHLRRLLNCLLEPNVQKRATIKQLLHCKWLQEPFLVQYKKSMVFSEQDVHC